MDEVNTRLVLSGLSCGAWPPKFISGNEWKLKIMKTKDILILWLPVGIATGCIRLAFIQVLKKMLQYGIWPPGQSILLACLVLFVVAFVVSFVLIFRTGNNDKPKEYVMLLIIIICTMTAVNGLAVVFPLIF